MKLTNRQALEAQVALGSLISMNLPVKTSIEVANLSAVIDSQVFAFGKVRDSLIKNYKVKLHIGEKEGTVEFETQMEGEDKEKEAAIIEFMNKVNELMVADGEDIRVRKIKLPNNIAIKPDVIKPLLSFIEMEE